jgi:hypothetical protein
VQVELDSGLSSGVAGDYPSVPQTGQSSNRRESKSLISGKIRIIWKWGLCTARKITALHTILRIGLHGGSGRISAGYCFLMRN